MHFIECVKRSSTWSSLWMAVVSDKAYLPGAVGSDIGWQRIVISWFFCALSIREPMLTIV